MLRSRLPFAVLCGLLAVFWHGTTATQTRAIEPIAEPAGELNYPKDVLPVLQQYCGDCHSGWQPAAGIDFEKLDISRASTLDRNVWKKVFTQLDSRIMPPVDAEQPSPEDRQRLLQWVEGHALKVVCNGPAYPGRVTLRRLNRDEYNRTIRDLVGVDFQPAATFPSDDVGYGFDNVGDVLTLPPVLFERYLEAADEVVRRAILVPEADFAPIVTRPGKTLGSVAEAGDLFSFPATADYIFRIEAHADQAGPELAKMAYLLDGKELKTIDIPATSNERGTYEMTQRVEQGKHRVTVKFLNDYYQPNDPDPKLRGDRNLYVTSVSVIGPIGVLPEELPESHRRLIPNTVETEATREAQLSAIRANLTAFLPRAFRRPVESAEVERYVRVAQLVLDDKSSLERAMQVAIQAALVSPQFLFRVEKDPPAKGPVATRNLDPYELASRMSYFLWSTMPDEELLRAARQGELDDSTKLDIQIQRMLKDPKSDGLIKNFAGQWLQLRNLDTISIDSKQYKEFTPEMRADMRRETEMLFSHIMQNDRSVIELLTADYTFVNERLAKLYDLNDVQGEEFRRVSLAGSARSGLLGQASILTVTSNPTRTSPVKRGKWILENLLAAPPPSPPPNVPALEVANRRGKQRVSLREQLELHRSKAECAGCHRLMDPLGFGLENFNPIGRWREEDQGFPIEPLGELPDGRTFRGAIELHQILLERKAEFRRCIAGKLLTFAIGRGLEYFDECTLNDITEKMESDGDKFSVLVREIIQSPAFRSRARTSLPQ